MAATPHALDLRCPLPKSSLARRPTSELLRVVNLPHGPGGNRREGQGRRTITVAPSRSSRGPAGKLASAAPSSTSNDRNDPRRIASTSSALVFGATTLDSITSALRSGSRGSTKTTKNSVLNACDRPIVTVPADRPVWTNRRSQPRF